MQPHLQKYLSIVLIALAVQSLAPMAASWAAAIAASDRFGLAEICHSHLASDPGRRDQDDDHRAHDGACPICRVAQASPTLNTPQLVVVAVPYRAVAQVKWHEQILRQGRSSMGAYGKARGPPLSM